MGKRELYGRVFGVGEEPKPTAILPHLTALIDLPAWVIFHAMLGYTLLAVGFGALLLRLPFARVRKQRWLHSYFGYAWIFGTVWMPVTAIWCVYSFTGWDVVAFFIFSMFASVYPATNIVCVLKPIQGLFSLDIPAFVYSTVRNYRISMVSFRGRRERANGCTEF